jgi:hypothetical protein
VDGCLVPSLGLGDDVVATAGVTLGGIGFSDASPVVWALFFFFAILRICYANIDICCNGRNFGQNA